MDFILNEDAGRHVYFDELRPLTAASTWTRKFTGAYGGVLPNPARAPTHPEEEDYV